MKNKILQITFYLFIISLLNVSISYSENSFKLMDLSANTNLINLFDVNEIQDEIIFGAYGAYNIDDGKTAGIFSTKIELDRDFVKPLVLIFASQSLTFAWYNRNPTPNQTILKTDNFIKYTQKEPVHPDGDPWETNWTYHPMVGSEYYLACRNSNFTWYESFLIATFASFLWEYGVETWYETPSATDLIITSTIGSVLGEFRYFASMELKHIRNKQFYHYIVWTIIDPIIVCGLVFD